MIRKILVGSIFGAFLVGCTSTEPVEQVDQSQIQLSEAILVIESISPQASSELSGVEVIRASVNYEITPFVDVADLYIASVHFDSNSPERSISVLFDQMYQNPVVLGSRSGAFDIEYPVSLIRNRRDLRLPLTVRFVVHQVTGERTSKIIGRSEPVVFSVSESW